MKKSSVSTFVIQRLLPARLVSALALSSIIAVSSGCSLLKVYTIDVPQGTPITQQQAQRVKIGMNSNQVLYLLGNPAFRDTIESNRWDYLYDYEAGTLGERKGKPDVHDASHHLVIYFVGGKVSEIKGLESLPTKIVK